MVLLSCASGPQITNLGVFRIGACCGWIRENLLGFGVPAMGVWRAFPIHESILPHKHFEGIPTEVMSVQRLLRTGIFVDSHRKLSR